MLRSRALKIEKTDAHHHLWPLGSPHYPMLSAPPSERYFGNTGNLPREFSAAQFLPLVAAQNVTRSIYVESHYEPPIDETAVIDAFAAEHGFPNAIVGRVDFMSPNLGRTLDHHMRSTRFKGVRAILNWDEDPLLRGASEGDLMANPNWRAGYAEFAGRGLSVELLVAPSQLGQLADHAANHPDIPLIVGHAGLPFRRTSAEHRLWQEGMARLASSPHVAVKISGLGMVDHGWTVASIEPLVLELINTFSAERCMFGSNFPVDGLQGSYDAIWDAFDVITAELDPAARTSLFRGTAQRIYALA